MTKSATKKCSKCLKTKRISSFYKHEGGKYGVRGRCKACSKVIQKENRHYYKPSPKMITPTAKRQATLYEQGLRECQVCKAVKQLTFFYEKRKGDTHARYDNLCSDCLKQYKKEWHLKRNLDVRIFLYQYREKNGCIDCGIKDPRVLEFDHLKDKKFNLGQAHMISGLTIKEVKKEVRKCVVRCSNCHKIKTHNEQDTWLNAMFNKSQVKETSL